MKNKIRVLLILLILSIVITGIAVACSYHQNGAPCLDKATKDGNPYVEDGITYQNYILEDGKKVRTWVWKGLGSDMMCMENRAECLDSEDDSEKVAAKLDENYRIQYIARDIAYYNNVYCVSRGRALDNKLFYRYQYDPGFNATGYVEIIGNTAKFYKITGNDGAKKTEYVGETSLEINNVIAGILAEKNPNELIGDTTVPIYKGNGSTTINHQNASGNNRYKVKHTITQYALWSQFNTWVDQNGQIAINAGFEKYTVNNASADAEKENWSEEAWQEKGNEQIFEYLDDPEDKAATEALINVMKSNAESKNAKQYKVKIYFIKEKMGKSGLQYRTQNQIVVETEDTIDIPVTKVWKNEGAVIPGSVKINLLANGKETGDFLYLSSSNKWKGTFTDLELTDASGKEITYDVKEVNVLGYISSKTGNQENGFTITNTLETINIDVSKRWNNTTIGMMPESILVRLYKDGTATNKTLLVRAEDGWHNTFTKLQKYDQGREIVYTIKEETPDGYVSEVTGEPKTGFTITNTLQSIEIPVTKVWDDNNNFEELRPDSVTVVLYENGVATTKTVELNENNSWKATFTDLPEFKNGTKIEYTVKEEVVPNGYDVEITGDTENGFIITNKCNVTYEGYIEITGKVWLDKRNGKDNEMNGLLDSDESGLEGIKVVLKDQSGVQFDATSTAVTDSDGIYTIKVNYDNSQNVYKTYQKYTDVYKRLINSYVEFEYDAVKYTTVATLDSVQNASKTMANTSKAVEDENARQSFDIKYAQITDKSKVESTTITANTKSLISFRTYNQRTRIIREEVLKYRNGDGTYSQTNPNGVWLEPIHGEAEGSAQIMRTYGIEVTRIQSINLGLFERENPDVAIFSDISKVEVTMKNQQYTYVYGARSQELEAQGGPLIKYQNKDQYGAYTYKRPVNPADIAYINSEVAAGNEMQVKVTYQVKLANLSKTLPVTVHNIKNYYDSRYTLDTTGWDITAAEGYNTATPNKDINVLLQPGTESEAIELTYTVSVETIKSLLRKEAGFAALNNVVEIQSYSTTYGEKTLYAEQRTGQRTGNPYAGYDYDSHPGNAGVYLNEQGVLEVTKLEDDTDIAPSFELSLDERYYKILSGNVWEDSDANAADEYRLGDGKKADTDNNVENVKAELYRVKDDGTLEIAKLYSIVYDGSEVAEVKTKDAIAYTNSEGYYAFGDENYSVVTDKYIIKFTYGTGIDGTKSSSINGTNISARDYKSTIISTDTELNGLFKGTSTVDDWYVRLNKGYSIAVDNIEERAVISDLQYSNFNNGINITATSKPFTMQLEFNPSDIKESVVGVDGYTTYGNESNVFDFGIIERAREDVFVNTTMDYLKITLANGQVLTEGNPQVDNMNYAKLVGFQQNINSGEAARRAIEKQLIMEMDTELIQGAQLEVRYQISVTNNSEKDIDCYVGNQYKTEFYYFGTNNENSPEITESVNKVITYMDAELTYTWENDSQWTQVSASELKDQGYISEATYNAIANNEYLMFITNTTNNLLPGQTNNYTVTARKLLANTDENSYDIQAEILEIDAKTARTTPSKQYKMGNYVPSLVSRVINTDINLERAGLHEQDDDRLKIVITPPTGAGNYIVHYIITGLISLIVIGIAVMFIKKKVLK